MSFRKDFVRVALFLLFITATVIGASVLWTLNEHVRKVNIAEQSDPLWIASQLQFELLRLKDDLDGYAYGDKTPADVQMRFEIAWSRINIVQSGKMAELVATLNVKDSSVNALEGVFRSIEPFIDNLPGAGSTQAERRAAIKPLLDQLTPYDSRLRDFSLNLAQSKAQMMSNFRNGVLSLSHTIFYLFGVIMLLAMIFVAFLILELRISRAASIRLERLATQAASASAAKDRFMSAVSHELRTPLTSIIGGIRLLKSNFSGNMDDSARRVVLIAERNSERLLSLVNDILDAQSVLEGKVTLKPVPVNLTQTIRNSVEDCQAYASQFGVSFAIETSDSALPVVADADRISQVLVNFLSNAAKFTRSGDVIVARGYRRGAYVRVEVEDHGIGIPQDEHENIFTRFHQINPGESGSTKSSGLGLSISKQMIEMHNGRIGFDSIAGAGSTFWFELLLQAAVSVDSGDAEKPAKAHPATTPTKASA